MMIELKKLSIIILTSIIISLTISTVASAADDPWDWYSPTVGGDEWFLFGLGLTVCLILFIVPLIIAILACIWIYKDAEKRSKSGAIWVILLIIASVFGSFLGFIIVIVVWLAIRPPIGGPTGQQTGQGNDRICPNCGRTIPFDANICPYCERKPLYESYKQQPIEKQKIEPYTKNKKLICKECGTKCDDTHKYCEKCGKPISQNAEFCKNCGSKIDDN